MCKTEQSVPEDWYRNWFDERYLTVYRHRNQCEAERFVSQWRFWRMLKPGGWCLDLGCGAGRYARAIERHGQKVLGIDLSRPLLRIARKSRDSLKAVYYVRADMRAVPSAGPFSLVVSLFTSFGYFNDDENIKLLKGIRELLSTGGFFVIDLPNPAAVRKAVSTNPITVRDSDGMRIREERHLDGETSRVIKQIDLDIEGGKYRYFESIRLYERDELEALMQESGFRQLESCWGDYDGSRYKNTSPRLIYFGYNSV